MVPGNATDANVTSYGQLGLIEKNSKSYGWLYQRPHILWAFLNIVTANMGTNEDAYAEKLSDSVLNFASVRGNVVHEVFLFVYVHCVNSVRMRSYLLVRIFPYSDWIRRDTLHLSLSVFSPNVEKYGPEKTPYLDTFHAVVVRINIILLFDILFVMIMEI